LALGPGRLVGLGVGDNDVVSTSSSSLESSVSSVSSTSVSSSIVISP